MAGVASTATKAARAQAPRVTVQVQHPQTGERPPAPNARSGISSLLLRNVPLFANLGEAQIEAMASVVRREKYPRGAAVIKAGDASDSLYVVITGRLKVVINGSGGREVILSLLGPREYFGEMVPIDDPPRSASVITVEPAELLVLAREDFRRCLQENFAMTLSVMRCLVKRLREADRKIGSLALMDVYGRVAAQLMAMSELVDGRQVVTRKLFKQDLANMVGASREMVSRVMRALQDNGVIEVRRGVIYLCENVAALD